MDLVLNADDFGRSPEINRAVIRAHLQGVLNSASLMVAGDAAEEAVVLARQNPALAVGLHLVIVDGPAVLPASRIPHLVDQNGRFANRPVRLGLKYAFSAPARRELAAEIRAQFERFAEFGLPLSHVDGHQHMHMHPWVFDLVLPLAREFGARRVRVVRDNLRLALQRDASHVVSKVASALIFGALGRRCRGRLEETGLAMSGRTYGFFQSGAMDERYVLAALRQTQIGDEIYFHPTEGRRLDSLGPNPEDLQTLLSPRVEQAIASLSRLTRRHTTPVRSNPPSSVQAPA